MSATSSVNAALQNYEEQEDPRKQVDTKRLKKKSFNRGVQRQNFVIRLIKKIQNSSFEEIQRTIKKTQKDNLIKSGGNS